MGMHCEDITGLKLEGLRAFLQIENCFRFNGMMGMIFAYFYNQFDTFFFFYWILDDLECKIFAFFYHFLSIQKLVRAVMHIGKKDAQKEESEAECAHCGKLGRTRKAKTTKKCNGEKGGAK